VKETETQSLTKDLDKHNTRRDEFARTFVLSPGFVLFAPLRQATTISVPQ